MTGRSTAALPLRVLFSLCALIIAQSAQAQTANPLAGLERVGPVSNAGNIGGFPTWYQDKTGLVLEFCAPSVEEMAAGYCLLLPGDANPPEDFNATPPNFADEHFYYSAGAEFADNANFPKVLLWEAAIEAAFAVDGRTLPGEQITFTRIRVRLDPVPVTGDYTFEHPYGTDVLPGVAGERIFWTEDVGVAQGVFTGALNSRVGPFLIPSGTPGGPELPPHVGPTGRLYIADPGTPGPVTGSPVGQNFVRITGPTGSNLGGPGIDVIETQNFSLVGRIFTGQLPGRVTVDRASYARNGSGTKVDVFATGLPATSGRVPPATQPTQTVPVLSFFDAPCSGTVDPNSPLPLPPFGAPAGAVEKAMAQSDVSYWGQLPLAAIPALDQFAICVKDASARNAQGAVVPAYYMKNVVDEITITESLYDPNARSLSVKATSSDEVDPPVLSVLGFDLASGAVTIPNLAAPPHRVTVLSTARGSNDAQVTSTLGTGGGTPTGPVANNDSFTFNEDSGAQSLAVLSNDTGATGGTVALTGNAPRLGTAVVSGSTVTYTPSANASGADSFQYTVTVGVAPNQVTSNVATVTVTITAANDAPVAVNDGTFFARIGVPTTLPNLLANDTDADGAADLAGITGLTAPRLQGSTATDPSSSVTAAGGGFVTFTASTSGTRTFTYQAQDAASATSAAATVTVSVVAGDTLNVTLAEFRADRNRLRVGGTSNIAGGQTVTVAYANGSVGGTSCSVTPSPAACVVGSTTVTATGTWLVERLGTAVPTSVTQVRATSSLGGTRTVNLVRR